MSRGRLLIAYDGSSTGGWQAQSHGNTVQQRLETALACLLREPIRLFGASRTDRGVHALGQVAHFDHTCPIEPYRFLYSLNGLLPSAIRVLSYGSASSSFHSQYDAQHKTYWYDFHLAPYHLPWTYARRLRVPPLNTDLLKEACALFIGTHNFRAFRNSNHQGKRREPENTIRTLFKLEWHTIPAGMRLIVVGNGFLYKMIRNLVGALLALDKGKVTLSLLEKMLRTGERSAHFVTAPGRGLCLHSVSYEPPLQWIGAEKYQLESWI
ncbi:tRNA pseudouridine(38-40) synthase TruA [Candidatus Similichlamydia laticola]|uniref:tRNA pseudouridine synthase A n=1 Tax=Candidatus Similichlamydia laticola TaxID=2170265 RepID=A0A369KHK6_9BACT|nr:tRNA pseudouridine(38-40) synthase TruA [Candidatus Similichlamydia laticola]RDB31283.1 tRNA pseudouridine synthase A [Candidatus Similichlamydia laticola]